MKKKDDNLNARAARQEKREARKKQKEEKEYQRAELVRRRIQRE